MDKAAIVILNWNGLDCLKKFLDTVARNSINQDTILYVADNGSTDGSPDWILNNFPSIRLIRFDKNHGFAAGYNLALEQIDAEYFILLNSDIEPTPGWVEPLISFMDDNPDAASCQSKILSWYKKDHFEHAGAAGGFIDKYGYPFCRGRIFYNVEKDNGQYDSRLDIFWSSGACMIVRASAWHKCYGFDPDFFAHMEEIDLCWRFHRAGYRVCFIPESVVFHVGGSALPYNSPLKTYLNFRNNLFLLYKNLPENKLHTILFIRKLLDWLAAFVLLLNWKLVHIKSIWEAHIDYHKSIELLKKKREMVKKLSIEDPKEMIMNKSIVFEFYIKGNRTFDRLKTNI